MIAPWVFFLSLKVIYLVDCLFFGLFGYACWENVCTMEHMWRSEDNFWKSVVFFCLVGSNWCHQTWWVIYWAISLAWCSFLIRSSNNSGLGSISLALFLFVYLFLWPSAKYLTLNIQFHSDELRVEVQAENSDHERTDTLRKERGGCSF